jgi:uncharacterized protein
MRALVLICLLVGLSAPLAADELAHRASAERFLKLAKAEGMTAPVYEQVAQLITVNFSQMGGSLQYEPILAKYQQRARAEVDRVLSWEAIRDELIDLYLPLFSEEEFDELSRFYESEVGRRLMDNLPELTHASMAVSRSRVEERLAPRIQDLVNEMGAEVEQQQGGLR